MGSFTRESPWRGFKRENDKGIRNGEKTELQRIEIVVFFYLAYAALWPVFHHEIRHYDVITTNYVMKYAS